VELEVGTVVVYPPHGVGKIAARETRVVLGVEQEVVVLELADGLSSMLTLDRAREQLRPLVTEAGLRKVRATLREDSALSDEIWSKRLKDVQDKLRRGDPEELAAIVRDGVRRDRALEAGNKSKLSVSERALFVKARELLSDEIGLARGLDADEANAWIDEQLASLSKPS
jgi:CarD family transcriptional regulator